MEARSHSSPALTSTRDPTSNRKLNPISFGLLTTMLIAGEGKGIPQSKFKILEISDVFQECYKKFHIRVNPFLPTSRYIVIGPPDVRVVVV